MCSKDQKRRSAVMERKKRALVIFAKEPRSAPIKTRLKKVLSFDQRLKLYEAFLRDARQICLEVPRSEKIVAFDSRAYPKMLKQIFKGFVLIRQQGSDLGQRMHHVFCLSKKKGIDMTVILGTDSPDLPVSFVRSAFRSLKRNDLVLGPCQDGGYYLIGLRDPCEELFCAIPWSSSQVFKKTLDRANKIGLKTDILPEWWDVDVPDDIKSLTKRIGKKKKIAKYTKEYFDGA